MDVWTYGRMDVWTYGRMDVWTYGRMDVWTYGRMGPAPHLHTSTPPHLHTSASIPATLSPRRSAFVRRSPSGVEFRSMTLTGRSRVVPQARSRCRARRGNLARSRRIAGTPRRRAARVLRRCSSESTPRPAEVER